MRRPARSRLSTAAVAGLGTAGLSVLGLSVLGLSVLGLSAWEGTVVQSSAAAHWSALAVIAAVLGAAAVAGRGRQRSSGAEWVRLGARTVRGDFTGTGSRSAAVVWATAAWVVVVAATIGWDLNSFAHQAHDLPTLSRLVGAVTRHGWGRALLFAAWVALGGYLAAGGRRPVAEPGGRAR